MSKRLLLSVLALAGLSSSGCMFFRKSDKPKENSSIASDVEESFRRRWVDKRAGELAATGVPSEAARMRAEHEFRERYDFGRRNEK